MHCCKLCSKRMWRASWSVFAAAPQFEQFIQGLAQIVEPLRKLTMKHAAFVWSTACNNAMSELKDRFTTAPVLAYPSFRKPYTVETDASISSLGAVLSQMQQDGNLHPVAYASRLLSAAERNYCITELELLLLELSSRPRIHHVNMHVGGPKFLEQDLKMSRSYIELDNSIAMLMPCPASHMEGPQPTESLKVGFKCRTSSLHPLQNQDQKQEEI